MEEVNALRLKKSVFVMKPKDKSDGSGGENINGDEGVLLDVSRGEEETKYLDDVAAAEYSCNKMVACNKMEAGHEEASSQRGPIAGCSNIPTEVSVSHVSLIDNVGCDMGEGTTHVSTVFPTFEVGYHTPQMKKPLKTKKKRNGEAVNVLSKEDRRVNIEHHNDTSDWSGKRKAWDMDVVIEDSETIMKKILFGEFMGGRRDHKNIKRGSSSGSLEIITGDP